MNTRNTILLGDARELARTLPDESISMIVTSPPYFGLRDYGVDGQMGLEDSPDAYVAGMVALFRELRRVLRSDGTLWLNLGDSYYNYRPGAQARTSLSQLSKEYQEIEGVSKRNNILPGLKEKDLMGIPWRVALALQADGWYLRSDIILAKRNPMPESVKDRPTRSHEYVFMLSKSPRYFYDADAIREANSPGSIERFGITENGQTATWNTSNNKRDGRNDGTKSNEGFRDYVPIGRNKRTVWDVVTRGYPKAHFATFNPDWIRPMILAGTSARGVCGACGAPWARMVERTPMEIRRTNNHPPELRTRTSGTMVKPPSNKTTGWQPGCTCDAETVPAVVLDPFMGAGTTAVVCVEEGRHYLGFELNSEYVAMAQERIRQTHPSLFSLPRG